ncbi:hypothetical protein A1O7_04840 [Cladophialophora yegresii CBS 114405]|uniref:Uncharacterized protein n=1 Tax=Cladophialophora yegresii CBS 114405 TaxID=1182544 RepID=W9VXX0_9EURO|nr:uncharacterized protein A1O7_04840 [Cladophialophora yegresii CBS 114405]EXJ60687.1 hypothetical protein A1O7_04840 [Cladophialophora yegresii CBS 114405]
MPRGAEHEDGKPQSDNAVEAGQDKIHGGGKTTDEVEISHAKKTAPLPDLSEVNDRTLSFGAAPGHQDGHGHEAPRTQGERTGMGSKNDLGKAGEHPLDNPTDESAIRR